MLKRLEAILIKISGLCVGIISSSIVTSLLMTSTTLAASKTVVKPLEQAITVKITDHGFSPAMIKVRLNQPVTLRIINQGEQTHEWGLPAYRIFTADILPKHSTSVSFSPWIPGSFPIVSETSRENQPEFTAKFIVSSSF